MTRLRPPQSPQRGIAPELLLSQVKNTMPYLFDSGAGELTARFESLPPVQVLRDFAKRPPVSEGDDGDEETLSHFEYFRLCLSAHFLSVGTPVPTDVDNQIRLRLWPAELPLEVALQMADLVLGARSWDTSVLSSRVTFGAAGSEWKNEALSGHLGEWFTVSCGAYCALKQYAASEAATKRQEVFEAITSEVKRHSEIFGSLWRAGQGLFCLRASASIAHNFGDLDRVMDMWELDVGDPLRLEFYKLAANPFDSNRKLRHLGRLWVAGELYKAMIDGSAMAHENHRYFALRKPRCLRQSPDFLIPIGPFFDDWGRKVAEAFATSEGLPSGASLEVIEALQYGWDRLPHTVSYGRALRGFQEVHSKLNLKVPANQKMLEKPQARFEKIWNDEALRLMDDIPSRA